MNTSQKSLAQMLFLLIVATVMLAACTSLGSILIDAQPMDSSSMLDAFHDAVNINNADAVLALFAEDAVVVDNGSVVEGKANIRTWVLYSQRMAGLHLTMLISKINGEKVSWFDTAHNGPELEHNTYLLRWEAIIRNGKIQSLIAMPRYWPDLK